MNAHIARGFVVDYRELDITYAHIDDVADYLADTVPARPPTPEEPPSPMLTSSEVAAKEGMTAIAMESADN